MHNFESWYLVLISRVGSDCAACWMTVIMVKLWAGARDFVLSHAQRLAWGLFHCVPDALFLGIKFLGHEAGHSPPSSARIKNGWSRNSTLPCLHDVYRDSFTCINSWMSLIFVIQFQWYAGEKASAILMFYYFTQAWTQYLLLIWHCYPDMIYIRL
jgi:hypothetical protein